MLIQVIGLWSVVALIVVWFIRDEQRRRDMRERVIAMAQFRPRQRPAPRPATPPMPTPRRRPVLSPEALALVASLGKLGRED